MKLGKSLRWIPLALGALAAAACSSNDAQNADVGGDAQDQADLRHHHDAGAADAANETGTSSEGGADAGAPPTTTDAGSVVDATPPPPSITPTVDQPFDGWSGTTSPDGVWRIAGVWTGTGGNTLDPANAAFAPTYGGAQGVLLLTSRANTLSGAEIQTLPTYGYGYYETRMQVASVSGVCDSFFWIETNYGSHEWDVEFLTNEPWLSSTSSGRVHFTIHPSEETAIVDLPFNPSKGFHRYGFLWKPGSIDFTVDGQIVHSFAGTTLSTTVKGYIMANTWTGNPNWGGGPPAQDATTAYDSMAYYANATVIP